MRSKQEILDEVERNTSATGVDFETAGLKNQRLIVELLLDIRTLLSPRGQSFPESAQPPVLDEKGRPR